MRKSGRPFIQANESPRPYSEIKAERRASDPELIRRARIMDEIERLEAEARALQCEAEELRCGLYHLSR